MQSGGRPGGGQVAGRAPSPSPPRTNPCLSTSRPPHLRVHARQRAALLLVPARVLAGVQHACGQGAGSGGRSGGQGLAGRRRRAVRRPAAAAAAAAQQHPQQATGTTGSLAAAATYSRTRLDELRALPLPAATAQAQQTQATTANSSPATYSRTRLDELPLCTATHPQ